MRRSRVARGVSLLMIPVLALLFAQPNIASAQANTYTLAKTYSNPFACSAVPTNPTFPATQAPAPGQCVAVHIAITNNNTAGGTAITNLTLSDNLPAALIGQTSSCFPVVNPSYTCSVSTTNFTFSTNGASYALNPGETGAENFIVQVSPSAACGATIQNTAGASASGGGSTFTGSNATANLTVQACSTAALTATKAVTVNGLGYSTTGTAHPGDTLTYSVSVTNNTGSPIAGVTVNDTIQPDQTLLPAAGTGLPNFGNCTYNSVTRVLSCSTASIAAGATALLHFSTYVGNTNTQIPNTATVTSTTGPTATTNTTVVTVTGAPPITTTGSILLCGLVSAYTPATASAGGTITVNGVVVPIAAGAVVTTTTGYALTNGAYTCVAFTLNTSGTATALSVQPSALGSVGLACGVFTPISATSINVGGLTIAVAPGATFMVGLVPGVGYCFLLNQSGVAFAALSGIPTSVQPFKRQGYVFREGFFRAQ